MSDEVQSLILLELREFRKETNARLSSLEDSRAEGRGMIKTIVSSGVIAGIVSWITGTIHH